MVDISERIIQIKAMVDEEKYFVINRGRQYGKTTTLAALKKYLSSEYVVVRMIQSSLRKKAGNAF